jgi:SAM-dependent methyltransferase
MPASPPHAVPADGPNAAQVEYWNAKAGLTWAAHHEALDRQIAPLGEEAIRHLAPHAGESVLDVGCGCGQTTLALANAVGPEGSVTGIDLSEPMLEVAMQRPRVARAGRVEFVRADAEVTPLGDERFDALYSRFGVMFFADPVRAFTNLRRSLKAGGRMAFVCWRPIETNPWMAEPLAAAEPFLPPRPAADPTAPGPYAFAEASRVRDILERAGFEGIEVLRFDSLVGGGTVDQALDLALRVGPLGSMLRETPALKPLVEGPVREVLARYDSPRGVLMPASVWIVTASRARP